MYGYDRVGYIVKDLIEEGDVVKLKHMLDNRLISRDSIGSVLHNLKPFVISDEILDFLLSLTSNGQIIDDLEYLLASNGHTEQLYRVVEVMKLTDIKILLSNLIEKYSDNYSGLKALNYKESIITITDYIRDKFTLTDICVMVACIGDVNHIYVKNDALIYIIFRILSYNIEDIKDIVESTAINIVYYFASIAMKTNNYRLSNILLDNLDDYYDINNINDIIPNTPPSNYISFFHEDV